MLEKFLPFFSITWAKKYAGKSKFTAILLKPAGDGQRLFSKDREILLIITKYNTLFPRLLDQAERVRREVGITRVDPVLLFVTGSGEIFEKETQDFNNRMDQLNIIIPFMNEAVLEDSEGHCVERQIKKYRQFKDLFDISDPVSEDIYYFGRQDFTKDVSDRLRRGNNIGIFGLRKMGKTSLIKRCEKIIGTYRDAKIVYIDLQNAALYRMRWWEVLEDISIRMGNNIKSKFNEENGAKRFGNFIRKMDDGKRYIVAFDEIEHICPGIASADHWNNDFIELWKTLRSIQIENKSKLSYLVSGVNASVVETSHIGEIDNPLFSMVSVMYMPEFSNSESGLMIDTIGSYMGVDFDDDSKIFINERFGGHPLLIRLACSRLFQKYDSPDSGDIIITESYVKSHISSIESDLYRFATHIIFVLEKWYPNEYSMLEWLSQGETEVFADLARKHPEYVSHLKNYRIIDSDSLQIKINLIMKYLSNRLSGKIKDDTDIMSDWQDITAIRNTIEPLLRKFIKATLKYKYGKDGWIKKVLAAVPEKDREKLVGIDADDILQSRLYLLNLREIINKYWDDFKFLESGEKRNQISKNSMLIFIDTINNNRQDAHAKDVSPIEMDALRISSRNIKLVLEDYLS
ncbi:hypothetical protein GCM10008960_28020 [Deinococcus sedimenti]|uniref:ATP-binding protein n=2 Tax=Deinococcus sedimenti TaxID=1867090 RepID=A0ABQ2S5R1_9DEIO|nr:hypothetical protein GCM10008960_28020 [Deinococcus sedimenti]